MPIENIPQPEIISINPGLRLKKYDGSFYFASDWYQDEDTLKLLDGLDAEKYDYDKLK